MYPRITVNTSKLAHNFSTVKRIADDAGVELFAVTKSFTANPRITSLLINAGFKGLADSRILNLKKLVGLPCKKMLIRLPMLSEVSKVVTYADISLNSNYDVINALNKEAKKQNKIHEIMLMIELGDLREGISPEHAIELSKKIQSFSNIRLIGIATNLTCYGGILPSTENMRIMPDTAEKIERECDIGLRYINGGNSSTMSMLINKTLPKKINHLRVGEVLIKGTETGYQQRIAGCFDDCFIIEAEIIEIEEKDSVPTGNIGLDAFGQKPTFTDKGRMMRAIVALGKQDTDPEGLISLDNGIDYIGGSGDHLIFDITRASKQYRVGDILQFNCSYGVILRAFTSEYVEKRFL